MRSIAFNNRSFEEYEKLRQKNKALHKKLLKILIEMQRGNPREGIGKPELLKRNYAGLWSRRLSDKDRVVYRFDDKMIFWLSVGIMMIDDCRTCLGGAFRLFFGCLPDRSITSTMIH